MLKDVTLGQYFPGRSVFHKADPRTKILLAVFFIVIIFFADSGPSYMFLGIATMILIWLSQIPIKTVLRSLKALVFIIAFTSMLNLFWVKGENILVKFWVITIYREGLLQALKMTVRLTCLLCGTSVILSYTTTPIALTDGLERLLSPLNKLHVPVHEFSMMMTIALRFIPTLIEETDKIMSAQKARGADFSSGGLIKRIKALIPVLIPLFVSAFRRADELAVAMECRCYHGGKGRTKMTKLRFSACDAALAFVFMIGFAALILLNNVHLAQFINF